MRPQADFYVHETAIVDERCIIGKGTMVWHFSHLMTDCVIGKDCIIGQNVFIASGVQIGNNVKVQNNVSIYAGVVCEDDVFLGPSMVFTNVVNPRSAVVRREQYTRTLVRRGATIGANATIVCGVEIGEFAFIGAGAVVTKSVAPYALMVGNPARQTGWMSEYGHRLRFDNDGHALCPESQQRYTLSEGKVIRES
ncbi:MAG: acyltransferase [Bacteroidales bacterium]|nr:N-acetyltransferase [Lentimicrobiaceae bacterium]MDD5694942.1 acyltransferase [Bacteroidales bacterium]